MPARPRKVAHSGRLITFEGGEGAGKSTQLRRLARRLEQAGLAVTVTREPGGTPAAEAIRDFVLSGRARDLGHDAEAILFAAARADHVDRLIRPALTRGEWVLCDRFIDSTRAYQGSAGVDARLIRALERVAVGDCMPDLTLVLDLPVESGLARMAARARGEGGGPDRFEQDGAGVHQRRREAFLAIAREEPERCVVIDAGQSEEAVAAAIWTAIRNRLPAQAA